MMVISPMNSSDIIQQKKTPMLIYNLFFMAKTIIQLSTQITLKARKLNKRVFLKITNKMVT